jgi:hypothetical protein
MFTDNCGDNYKQLNFGKKMKDITFHPTKKDTLIALNDDNNFMYSKDQGKTWEIKENNIQELTFAKFSDNAYFAN